MDWDEFEYWLKQQTQETCVKIAARAVLRVFPLVTHFYGDNDQDTRTALLTARAILTSGVAGVMQTPEVSAAIVNVNAATATYAAATDAHDAARTAGATYGAARADAGAAAADAHAAYVTADATYATALAARAAARAARAVALIARRADATYAATFADTKIDPRELFETPIWHKPREPDWLVSALIPVSNLLDSGPEWSFWREWYQGFLDGKPLDWELQKEIALIPDADWEKGPEWIAGLIEIIRKRREVEAAITAVKDEISGHRATIAHRTHNQPPEIVDEVSEQFTIIWDHLSEIEDEIADGYPAIEKLRQLLLRTLAYAKAIGLYVVSLGDAALKKAAEEIGSTGGKWVVRAGVAYFAAQTPPVQSGLQKVGTLLSELIKLLQ